MISPPCRILVTGSRNYSDIDKVQKALWAWALVSSKLLTPLELVHGACPYGGLDLLASRIWEGWGLPVLPVPAERSPDGRFLGPERNQKMVEMGGYAVCLAFPLQGSRGTFDCMRKAQEAGILTMEIK